MRLLALLLLAASSAAVAQQTSIQVDLARPQGRYTPIYSWFGYDEANYTTAPHGQQLLRELHDLSPVPVHIRAHNLFTTGDGAPQLKWSSTNIYTEDAQGKPVYSWTILDGIFDTFAATGVRPMVELGFMPEALSTHPDPYHVQYPADIFKGGWAYPPRDYARWRELVRQFTAHMVARYGAKTVSQWYFEVWNEPDIGYWHGTAADYDRLYDNAVAGVRAALPGAIVGGPATTGPHSPHAADFLTQFLDHCARQHQPLDFISFHVKGAPKVIDGHVRMGLDHELADAEAGFRIVSRHKTFAKLPIILSEADPEGCAACSAREHPENNYRNGPLYASYTATAMNGLFALADKYQVNLLAMLSWSFEFEGRQYFEGFRSLATNGIDKPVLNVFRMAGLMAGERVKVTSTAGFPVEDIVANGVRQSPDIDALATRGERQAGVMLWNYHDEDVPAQGAEVSVAVKNIPAGVKRVLVQHFRIDDDHSNAYTVWKAMGSPQAPTAAQVAQLKAAGQLQLLTSPVWVDAKDGVVTLPLNLPRQAVSLLRLSW